MPASPNQPKSIMAETLFLYVDILGFTELVKHTDRVEELFRILDGARLHMDSNFRTIVFSDTILAYNRHVNLSNSAKAVELMYLIELTQELMHRLTGKGIFFRAVITQGNFVHAKLTHLEAYYGEALISANRAEKGLVGTGLFLDRKLRSLQNIFKFKAFSDQYDFVYLTHITSGLLSWRKREVDSDDDDNDASFPLPAELLTAAGIELMIYQELVHFREVHALMNCHTDPAVRAKHLATWNMYVHAYPGLMRELEARKFDFRALAELDWSEAKSKFEAYYQ